MFANKTENNSTLKTTLIFSFIICIAITIRLQYLSQTEVYKPIRADSRNYALYAQNLLNHGVFSKEESENPAPDSFWSPGYPTLLASVLHVSGGKHFYRAALFVQALLGALTAGMVFIIGSFFLPLGAAFAAGVLTACSPHLISLGGYLLTETLFAFTMVSFLLTYIIAGKTGNSACFALAGVAAGVSYLVNPVIFFAPFLFVAIFFLKRHIFGLPSGFKQKKAISFFLAAFIVPWLLWSVRCYLNVPSTSRSSSDRALVNLIIGAHHDYFDIYRADPRNPENPAEIDIAKVDGSWPKFLSILARRVKDNPGHYIKWYLFEKPRLLYKWDILMGAGDVYVYSVTKTWFQTSNLGLTIHSIMKSIHSWLIFLCVFGGIFLVKSFRRSKSEVEALIYALLVYVSAVYVVLQAEPRYSIPLRPAMYLGAMFGIWKIRCVIGRLTGNKRMSAWKG
jgi:4-amino-4-deoxy-L-arabinose transferase-like glycosyltransferase